MTDWNEWAEAFVAAHSFDESEHPRAKDGKFTRLGGGVGPGLGDNAKAKKFLADLHSGNPEGAAAAAWKKVHGDEPREVDVITSNQKGSAYIDFDLNEPDYDYDGDSGTYTDETGKGQSSVKLVPNEDGSVSGFYTPNTGGREDEHWGPDPQDEGDSDLLEAFLRDQGITDIQRLDQIDDPGFRGVPQAKRDEAVAHIQKFVDLAQSKDPADQAAATKMRGEIADRIEANVKSQNADGGYDEKMTRRVLDALDRLAKQSSTTAWGTRNFQYESAINSIAAQWFMDGHQYGPPRQR